MIIGLFNQLQDELIQLSKEVQANDYWLMDISDSNPTSSIANALLDLWYQGNQDGRQTRIYPGLIAVTSSQLKKTHSINGLKRKFHQAVLEIKENDSYEWRKLQSKLIKRNRVLNEALSDEGINRLHLKQVIRTLPIVEKSPKKVGFNWYTSGRSISKITKQQAWDLLTELNTESDHIKIQMDKLATIKDSEPLARVQKQAPVLRSNILFKDGQRKAMNVSLPLIFPQETKNEFPEFIVPSSTPPKNRSRQLRSDTKIDDEPFLPSIRVHRYR